MRLISGTLVHQINRRALINHAIFPEPETGWDWRGPCDSRADDAGGRASLMRTGAGPRRGEAAGGGRGSYL
jgi:hypothetical protein